MRKRSHKRERVGIYLPCAARSRDLETAVLQTKATAIHRDVD